MSHKVHLIDDTLQKIKFLLTITGVDIENNQKGYKRKIVFYLNFISLNLDVAAAFNYLFDSILNGENFLNITYSAPCITFCLLSNLKLVTILYNSKKVNELLSILRKMEIKSQLELTPEKERIIKEERSFLHQLFKALNLVYCFLLIGFSLNPLSIIMYKYLVYERLVLGLPFLAKYPFRADDLKIWPAIYIRQVWSVITVIVYFMIVDYLFYIYAVYIRIQFRLLQHALERMLSVSNIQTVKEMELNFRKIVMWHTELIQSTQKLEAIYTKSTLFNFIVSSILICLTGFDVMVISDVMIVISFVSFLFTSLLQIFFLCFFGDLLARSSVEVGDAVYKSNWYSKHSKVRKNLLIVMIRSQKACKLTANNFADVNLSSFMKILKNAWSYFALLNTVYGLK